MNNSGLKDTRELELQNGWDLFLKEVLEGEEADE